MKTNAEIRAEFLKEYHLAYDGILPPDVVAKGVKWYEDFLLSKLDERMEWVRGKLVEIRDDSAPFNRDQLQFANNLIEQKNERLDNLLNSITKGSKED